jgi:hypothetical protein
VVIAQYSLVLNALVVALDRGPRFIAKSPPVLLPDQFGKPLFTYFRSTAHQPPTTSYPAHASQPTAPQIRLP